MVITNPKWWDGLPADVRKGLSEAMTESIKFGNQVAATEDANFRAKVIADNKAKVLPMNTDQLSAWRTAMKPVWSKFEGNIGKDLIDAAIKSNQ
jgi:C4-dicarboxylate-binding protein DctP